MEISKLKVLIRLTRGRLKSMANTRKIIEEGFEDEAKWDNRELGAEEEFAKRASPERGAIYF